MPPKPIIKAMKVNKAQAPIDIDGSLASDVGKMGLDDVEVQQEKQKKDWSDDSGDESYGKIGMTQRRYFSVYGGHRNDKFYIPPSNHREGEQGDHVIALNLNRYIITALEGENIKTLPKRFLQVAKSILPEKAVVIKVITDELAKRINESRNLRKYTTANFGNPQDRSMDSANLTQQISKIKSRFIEADRYDIHREIEDVASKFISMLDEANSFSKSRKANSKISSDKGIGEAAAVSHLISLDEFLGETGDISADFIDCSEGRSGVTRGSDLVGFVNFKRYRGLETPGHITLLADKLNYLKNNKAAEDVSCMLTHISTCMFSLLDYSRTGLSDSVNDAGVVLARHDDEVVLYKAIARLTVTTFAIFRNINSVLTSENKVVLYDKLIDEILDKKKWRITAEDAHFVTDAEGADKAITKELLKEGISEFAELDFEHGDLKMKDPNDPDLTKRPPTNFHYCIADNRPKGGNPDLTGSRSGSSELQTAASDFDLGEYFDERIVNISSVSTPLATGKKPESISSFQDDLEECDVPQTIAKQLVPILTPAKSPSPNSSETKT